jgi:Leucine-rich repeat (LRR) protein
MVFIVWATCFFFYAAHFVAASQSSALQLEANALLATGWWGRNDSSRCEWPGITCNGTGSVTKIVMSSGFYLGGEMSKLNLSCFPNLVRLDLRNASLQGSIPVEIGTLSKLTYLDLSYNTLTGPIPSTLGNLTNLEVLSLDSNQITGPIPPTFGNLTNLKFLSFGSNQINGSIPP